ncbi:hypothetical protein CH063_01434 [Colletotrichum higginsianum]|uniref:Uncharacterized protein n=1 Tax=Colletotrichum higginsianum (strain IMI 349063) TaxID=759273 RepID=H1V7C1_COLHI|nr:hypothetical protein CH063_01434 [Colletotrichum higginsianum]
MAPLQLLCSTSRIQVEHEIAQRLRFSGFEVILYPPPRFSATSLSSVSLVRRPSDLEMHSSDQFSTVTYSAWIEIRKG